ncbi:hypothetical protein Hypma_002110 [Hypsizygus marmoreus]|uniref:Uncharacterized protein n=1 Tax=Hypsizygus marmoreus TaxID=39966 RepID=A0A369K2M2_HYPMA|nr:hypothetical protein Hypma_002110 [Hypsizygus marmoreus]
MATMDMYKWLDGISGAEAPPESNLTKTVDLDKCPPKSTILHHDPYPSLQTSFKQIPPRSLMDQFVPQFVTSYGGTFDILFSIPDPVTYPLTWDDLRSPALIKQKYLHTLNIRDLLWVEEMKTEMDLRDQLKLDVSCCPLGGGVKGGIYRNDSRRDGLWVGQYALVRMRLLIKRACLGLSYIETSWKGYNTLPIDFEAFCLRRFDYYPDCHPRMRLKDYMKDPGPMYPRFHHYLNYSLEEMTLGFEGAW